jgi:aminoglycoside phosphotransferase family enzyme
MKLAATAALALSMAMLAPPASAQQRDLAEPEIELLAEMLAMGDVCIDVADFRVRRDRLHSWMTTYLAQVNDADMEAVLSRREAKQATLRSNVAAMQQMSGGSRQRDAVDNHYAGLTGRCLRLSQNSLAQEYIIYR